MAKIFKDFDWLIFLPVLVLAGFSLSILASPGENLFISQLAFFLIGFVLFFIFSQIDWQIYKSFAKLFYILSLLLLVLTFFGPHIRGATRWIEILGFRWQPSELVKPLLVISLASFFYTHPPINLKALGTGLLLLLPPLFIIFRQPDLGNVIILFGVWTGIVYGAGLPAVLGLTGASLFFLLLPLGWFLLRDYQKARMMSFLNPFFDPGGAGYNSIQAMIAIGSGQFLGRGLSQGPQSRLLFLPEHQTDFIFASLVEELGFVGGALVIFAYFILLYHILTLARNSEDLLATFILIGIFSQLSLQIFINIGMNLGIIPITGVTLPLLSYGGSSVISTMISLGIVANIGRTDHKSRAIDISL